MASREPESNDVEHSGPGYTWHQSKSAITMMIPVRPGTRGAALEVVFGTDSLLVKYKGGENIVSGATAGPLRKSGCTWLVSDMNDQRMVVLELSKLKKGPWRSVFVAHAETAQHNKAPPMDEKFVLDKIAKMRLALCEHVNFHKDDAGVGLPSIFLTNPHTFEPAQPFNLNHPWGLPDLDLDPMAVMQRRLQTQMMYWGIETPEVQFLNIVAKRREDQLLAAFVAEDKGKVLTMEISLWAEHGGKRGPTPPAKTTWRRLRVSAAVPLRAFADKILAPVTGFCRNYHWYCYRNPLDGTQIAPIGSQAIDVMHLTTHGHVMLDEAKFCLAHLLKNVGDSWFWIYDLGDHFKWEMKVVDVSTDSASGVELLDGWGEAPPEDSNGLGGMGNNPYYNTMAACVLGKASRASIVEASGAKNFRNRPNGWLWNPCVWDIELARSDLRAALESPLSPIGGEVSMSIGMFGGPAAPMPRSMPAATVPVTTRGRGNVVESEYQSTGCDSKSEGLCAHCGGAEPRFLCSRCQLSRYCSSACQRTHWPAHKLKCHRK